MGYRRARERNKRLERLEFETRHRYGAGAYYSVRKDRLVRYSCNSKAVKELCGRATRTRLKREADIAFGKSCAYKKIYDYWWIVT